MDVLLSLVNHLNYKIRTKPPGIEEISSINLTYINAKVFVAKQFHCSCQYIKFSNILTSLERISCPKLGFELTSSLSVEGKLVISCVSLFRIKILRNGRCLLISDFVRSSRGDSVNWFLTKKYEW